MDEVVHFTIPFDDDARAVRFCRECLDWRPTDVSQMTGDGVQLAASCGDRHVAIRELDEWAVTLTRLFLRVFLLVPVALMSAAACSGGSQQPAPPADSTAPMSAGKAVVTGRAAPGAIVTLESESASELPPPPDPAGMDQFGRRFYPDLLLVQAGQPIQFRNSENELHSVRVISENPKTTVYNVVMAPVSAQIHRLEQPGLYEVRCDFHEDMQAFIYVSSTPYVIIAGDDGRFTFEAVEPGSYTLTIKHRDQSQVRGLEVTLPRTEIGESRGI